MVSPIVNACPSEHKDKAMSLLHSFYCWGQVGTVAISTLFFALAGCVRRGGRPGLFGGPGDCRHRGGRQR